jgi:hypothetical protein
MDSIYRGEDEIITFALLSNDIALDLSTLAGYIVILYYKESGVVLKKYSKNTLSGYSPLTVISEIGGTFKVFLQSEDTKTANLGIIHAEVKTQITDAGFSSSTFHSVERGIEIGEIFDSISKPITTLV